MKSAAEFRAKWLEPLLSTQAADRPRAESAVRRLYAAAGFAEPRHVLWYDSPFDASWAVALLIVPHHHLWSQRLAPSAITGHDRPRVDRARASLGSALGIDDWSAVLAAIGAPMGMHLQFPPVPSRLFQMKLIEARFSLSSDVSSMFVVHGDTDDLQRAEDRFLGSNRGALRSALHCPTTDTLIGQSFYSDYSFSTMADDEHLVGDRESPAIMRAAWDVARASGLWWPFEHAVIMSERPAELHLNQQQLLHREDGPAVTYRDGWRVYAWNGKAVPERWIMETASVPSREYKGFDPAFTKFAQARAKPAAKSKPRTKPGTLLTAALPSDPVARLEQLRAHAGGKLPLFDRYQAGAHRAVWRELVALGSAVRNDAHAADALAVAYETMRRVDANVRTIVERLTSMRYTFVPDPTPRPHVPPSAGAAKAVAAFEKAFGTLPLSLRAFYEVVGEVNLIGRHPALDPTGNPIAPDPLVVYGLDEGLVEVDEDDDAPAAITIAPDDLHKANTSGGDPYEMTIPDLRADGELLHERHRLLFVDYLRLCFRFGGFPGYDGAARVPAEIAMLAAGLLEL